MYKRGAAYFHFSSIHLKIFRRVKSGEEWVFTFYRGAE